MNNSRETTETTHRRATPGAAKNYAALVEWLKPLSHTERLQLLRRAFVGEQFTPQGRLLAEWDRLVREENYPHPHRILTALRLSRDVDTCRDLLAGRPVDPGRLDPHELFVAKNRRLVRLDMTAIDDLEGAAA